MKSRCLRMLYSGSFFPSKVFAPVSSCFCRFSFISLKGQSFKSVLLSSERGLLLLFFGFWNMEYGKQEWNVCLLSSYIKWRERRAGALALFVIIKTILAQWHIGLWAFREKKAAKRWQLSSLTVLPCLKHYFPVKTTGTFFTLVHIKYRHMSHTPE